jgi:hypothetical protein
VTDGKIREANEKKEQLQAELNDYKMRLVQEGKVAV